jgi:hypothetical protein
MTVLGMDGKPMRQPQQHDIVAAMNSPRLFARWFPGSTWDNWRIALKGSFALPMTDDERSFFRTVADAIHQQSP